jgi:hypothetical protein
MPRTPKKTSKKTPKKQPSPPPQQIKMNGLMYNTIITLVTLYAIYLSFVRNNGFEPVSFLCALFFAPMYILYAWAVPPVQEGYSVLEKFLYGFGIFGIIAIIVWISRHKLRCTKYGIKQTMNNKFYAVCNKTDYMKWFISGIFVFFTPLNTFNNIVFFYGFNLVITIFIFNHV